MVPLCRGGRLCPPTTGLPPLSVGRDPCVPPRHTHFRRGTRAPPYRAQAMFGRTESSAPTAGQGAVRNGTSYPKGICSAALHCRTPSPTGGSPYPSVGRDPCVPPHDMHVFLSAGHAGPALQSAAITRRHGRTLCTPSLCNDVLTEKAVHYCAFNLTGSTI